MKKVLNNILSLSVDYIRLKIRSYTSTLLPMNKNVYATLKRKLFFSKIHSLKTENRVETFFFTVLTIKEVDRLRKRWEIVEYLQKGTIAHYKIAALVQVGIATVTRMSKHLQNLKKGSFTH